ncbi:hypothetical protein DLREEDagrD3_10450 [Denitratisoma sp. agr-D3]
MSKAWLLFFLPLLAWGHPLEGRIWDVRNQVFITPEVAYDRAASSRYVLLGESHDSTVHHRLQGEALAALAQHSRHPALALEQFDGEHQAALSAAQQNGSRDAEVLADAGQLNRKGWRWPFYRDLIAFAAERGWSLRAANLSRATAKGIVMGEVQPSLPDFPAPVLTALEQDIVKGHCGQRPPPPMLAGLVTAQRARDAHMAASLEAAPGDGAVLIAGAGHVRRDRAVPRYLRNGDDALAIAYLEVVEGRDKPQDYDGATYDLVWFTAATARADPCAKVLGGTVAGSKEGR